MIVDLSLLVHIEVRQPVVNHYDGGDVVEQGQRPFGSIVGLRRAQLDESWLGIDDFATALCLSALP